MTNKSLLAASVLLLAGARETWAGPTLLALRCENNGVYIRNNVTSQTIETNFGTTLMALRFTNSITFDFYSPPLASAVNVTTADKADGMVYLRNADNSGHLKFGATARMQYYDYDPASGTNVLLADTKSTNTKTLTDGSIVNYPLSKQNLTSNHALVAGHLLHVAVIIGVTSGNTGGFGELLYNGASGMSSYAEFPQNRPLGLAWPINPGPMSPPAIVSFNVLGDPVAQVHCSGTPGATYLLQATTNLCNPTAWKTIGTNIAGTNGLFTFTDMDATNFNCRFYRASTP